MTLLQLIEKHSVFEQSRQRLKDELDNIGTRFDVVDGDPWCFATISLGKAKVCEVRISRKRWFEAIFNDCDIVEEDVDRFMYELAFELAEYL